MKKTVNGLTMQQWIANETRRRRVKFWGTYSYIKPVIHPKKFGDGMQLAFMGTIDQRPHYWLIRIDSSIDLTADDFDYEKHLLEPLEEEFGRYPENGVMEAIDFKKEKKANKTSISEYDTFKDYQNDCKYPAIYWGGGHWGSVVNFKTGKVG